MLAKIFNRFFKKSKQLQSFKKVEIYRNKKILKETQEYLMTKGPSYTSLFFGLNGNWNFSEELPTVSIVFPQIWLFIQVHSHLSKAYTSLELLGIPKDQWENYQKEQAFLRSNAESFGQEIVYIEFFWDEAIDYCSVAEKLKKAGV